MDILSVDRIFFTIWDYPMSYIEFFGTILNLACVWLVARNKILNWPVGIAGTILFTALFYQIQLYADFFEQIYFLITGFWGWWAWASGNKMDKSGDKPVTILSNRARTIWVGTIIASTILLGYIVSNLHIYLPQFFQEAASYPYLDSFTTVMSFAATIMLIRKEVEAWYLWVLVDIIGIGLYWAKEVRLISLLYLVFLILATKGLFEWRKIYANKLATT